MWNILQFYLLRVLRGVPLLSDGGTTETALIKPPCQNRPIREVRLRDSQSAWSISPEQVYNVIVGCFGVVDYNTVHLMKANSFTYMFLYHHSSQFKKGYS